jgi:hypothetical protein
MNAIAPGCKSLEPLRAFCKSERGFCLAELLIAALVLVPVSLVAFEMLDTVQRTALYQAEVHTVLDNTSAAMDTISRILRQAGNDPAGSSVECISIISDSAIRVRSDLTGSLGPASPDKGDPDGSTDDSGEDVVIRHNAAAQSIELVPSGGSAQTIASNIGSLSIRCLDRSGAITGTGSAAYEIAVELTGIGTVPDPRTGRLFRLPLKGHIRLAARG